MQNIGSQLQIWRRGQKVSPDRTKWRNHHGLSIHDAEEAGFNKVVFIIRKDIFQEFQGIIGNRIKEQISI